MTARALVKINEYRSPSVVRTTSPTSMVIFGTSGASASAKQLPTGATLPPVNTPTLVRNLIHGYELFGWLNDPGATFNGKTYSGTYANLARTTGSGATERYVNTIPRALRGAFAKSTEHVIVIRISETGTFNDNVVAAFESLKSSNTTGIVPKIALIPGLGWVADATGGIDASSSATVPPYLDEFAQLCEDLEMYGKITATPNYTTQTNATDISGLHTALGSTETNVSVTPHVGVVTEYGSQVHVDMTPYLASAYAAEDATKGVAENPRGTSVIGVEDIYPDSTYNAVSASTHEAILRGHHYETLAYRPNLQIVGSTLFYPDTSEDVQQFTNVHRTTLDIKRQFVIISEKAADYNVGAAREYFLDEGETYMRGLASRGQIAEPSVQLDPDNDTGGRDIYGLVRYTSIEPAEYVELSIGPRN